MKIKQWRRLLPDPRQGQDGGVAPPFCEEGPGCREACGLVPDGEPAGRAKQQTRGRHLWAVQGRAGPGRGGPESPVKGSPQGCKSQIDRV